MERRSPLGRIWVLAALAVTVAAAGCGNDNGATPTPIPATNTAAPTASPTVTAIQVLPTATASPTLAPPTNTPTAQSTATPAVTATPVPPENTATSTATMEPSPTTTSGTDAVTGLLVLSRSVSATSSDALGSPPQQWAESADAKAFDRSLAAADWSIDGEMQGVTGPDGRFTADALPAGQHTLQISKTLDGNLASASIPFTVGDDGGADLIVEVSWGQVKSIATYTQDGVQVREVRAPNGNWVILRDGRVGSFGDWGRTFVDTNGDGSFEVTPCLDFTGTVPPASGAPCDADQACNLGERCACVPSCADCDDCAKRVCVASCPPVQITSLTLSGPSQIVVGQQGSMSAAAQLSDGSSFDVTALVDWISSDTGVATVDSWGSVTAIQLGSVSITAALGTLTSDPWQLQVTSRPPLRKIDLQNVSCVYPLGAPTAGGALPVDAAPPERSDILPVPNCTQVVQIGGTIQFRALGEFDNNYFQDITDEVQWQLTPPEVGSVAGGLFTGLQAGTATLTATLEGVTSDATEIRVVTQPTVIGLTIYAENSGFPIVAMGGEAPAPVASGVPCLMEKTADASGVPCCCPGPTVNSFAPCRCAYSITVLVGDQLKFHATAQYDTGAWKDVTNEVTWESGDSSVASIDAGGVMSALQAGDTAITATLDTVTSDPANVHVADHTTLQSIWIYQEGQDRVVAKGDQRFFHAMGNYDIGISREVTADITWRSSDPSVGGFDTPGVFTGRAAGDVQVWAQQDGVQSNQLPLEVYETSELSYCDPNNINRAVWSDDFNRVILESDCGWYSQPGLATLRYTVTEIQPHGGIFNPCLDLYVFAGETKVRTIRNEGCGDPFLAANAPGRDQEAVKYQLRAFWDLKDDTGNPVPPGTYTIYGRFYLYYDPVVSLDVTVLTPGEPTPTPGPITPTPTPEIKPTAVCTPSPCPTGAVLVCAQSGAITGTPGSDLGCCPDGWNLYPCTFANGQTGLACHNPAMECPSSEVCGEGCDPVVTGACAGCSDGCGYICVSRTPAATATPTAGLIAATLSAGRVSGAAGQTVGVPITIDTGRDNVAFFAVTFTVVSQNGAPAIPDKLTYQAAAGVPAPDLQTAVPAQAKLAIGYVGVTIDPPLRGAVAVGTLSVPIPADATGSYELRLLNLSAGDSFGNKVPLTGQDGTIILPGLIVTPTPTPACPRTATPYCSNACQPCPTFRADCPADPCGACIQNPTTCPTGLVRWCLPNNCCQCATPTPDPTSTPTACPTGTPCGPGMHKICPPGAVMDDSCRCWCEPSTPSPTPTPTCAPTGALYCSDYCEPCPTIRADCPAAPCAGCRQNPTSCPAGRVLWCGFLNGSNCCWCGTPTPNPDAAVTVNKRVDSHTVSLDRGQRLTYTIVVTNVSAAQVANVKLSDPLPGRVGSGLIAPPLTTQGGCALSSATVTCDLLDLAPGATVTVTIAVTDIPLPDEIPEYAFNTATVTADGVPPITAWEWTLIEPWPTPASGTATPTTTP